MSRSKLTSVLRLAALAVLLVAAHADSSSEGRGRSDDSEDGGGGRVACRGARSATYTVTFESRWSESGESITEHFSAINGWAHDGSREGRHWRVGSRASRGIENVAEGGDNEQLLRELRDKERRGSVSEPEQKTEGHHEPPFSDLRWDITVDLEHPWASHVAMIAPSPDWFLGDNRNMHRNGGWVEHVRANLGAYDAGTESGDEFKLDNPSTREPITRLRKDLEDGPGIFTFRLRSCRR